MRFGNYVFRPGLWPTVAGLFFFCLTLWLGNWQLSRAEYKQTLQDRYDRMQQDGTVRIGAEEVDKDDLLLRTVEVRGTFVRGREIYVDNRVYKTIAGFHVLAPLQIDGTSQHVLINRGWVALAGGRRDDLPAVKQMDGVVILQGIAIDTQTRYLELDGAAPQGKLWQNLNFEKYRDYFGKSLQPIVIEQTTDTGDGLVRDWPRPDTGVGTHISYAIQWFGLAGTLLVLWIALNIRKIKSAEE